jgi:hypothetical protein
MSDYPTEVLADTPLVYFRHGEASGTTTTDSSGNGHTGTYTGAPTLGAAGLLTGSADTAVVFTGASGQRAQTNTTVVTAGTVATFACECLFDIPATGTAQLCTLADPARVAPDYIELYYDTGTVYFDFKGTGGFSPSASGAATGVHHLVGEFNGTQLKLYIDGALIDTQAFVDAGAVLTVANSFASGGQPGGGSPATGKLDEAAFYTHALGATRVAAHYAASTTGGAIPLTSPLIFDTAREHLAVDLDLDWTAGNVTALLVLADTWSPDAGDDVVATILSAGAIETSGTRQVLGSPAATVSGGDHRVFWDGDPIVYPGVLNAETFDILVLYQAVTDDTDSYLLCAYNLGAQVGDGNNITLTPDTLGYVSI